MFVPYMFNLRKLSLLHETKQILKMFNIKPKKSLGQNFVVSSALIRDLIKFSSLSNKDLVLEIGAGIGTLTIELARMARKVIAVEIDKKLIEVLKWRLKEFENVEIIHGDILAMKLPEVDKVVSNLPFNISSPVTFKLIEEASFRFAVLTYQKEFAERMVAQPGSPNYGRLTVALNLLAGVEGLYIQSCRDFTPFKMQERKMSKL